jgi:hypothetical protein
LERHLGHVARDELNAGELAFDELREELSPRDPDSSAPMVRASRRADYGRRLLNLGALPSTLDIYKE